jgi:RNA polymerase sigma factor (sigma-70 family)
MHLCPKSVEDMIKRLLPAHNPNRRERQYAWNDWLLQGGADPVLKFIRWTNGTSTDDEEILQDTIITAYLKVEAGEYEYTGIPFTAFLKRIAWYKIMEASRQGRRQVALDDMVDYADEEQPGRDRADFWKEHEALKIALRQIPARRSQVLLLYENGYSTTEIAEQLGINEALVRKEKSLGMRQLKEKVLLAAAI